MAKCKYCQQSITRLDKEVCPFCGGHRPLDGTDTSTQDITKIIGQVENPVEIKSKKKIIAAVLAFVLGVLGIHHLYLGRTKHFAITLAFSLVLIVGLGSAIFFTVWKSPFAYLIPYFVMEAIMIFIGIGYLIRHDVTDSHGAFLK